MPGVDKAAVDLRARPNGDKRLVAWLVPAPGAAPDLTAIAASLAAELPDYMQPQGWMILPALPQTANGKLDRKALPEPGEDMAPAAMAPPDGPATETERRLTAIWAAALGQDTVSVTETLHALGADSLTVFRIAARMLGDGLNLEARDLIAHPSIRALAAFADARTAGPARPSLKDFRDGARRNIRRAS
jgi:aryl carrier-like protein